MKIVQIIEHNKELYGLSDDGDLYQYKRKFEQGKYIPKEELDDWKTYDGKPVEVGGYHERVFVGYELVKLDVCPSLENK